MYYENESFESEVSALKESMNRAMWRAMTVFGFDNSKGTVIYDFQVEYCYLINSIQRDSKFIATKQLSKMRELIASLRKECNIAKEKGTTES